MVGQTSVRLYGDVLEVYRALHVRQEDAYHGIVRMRRGGEVASWRWLLTRTWRHSRCEHGAIGRMVSGVSMRAGRVDGLMQVVLPGGIRGFLWLWPHARARVS